MSQLLWAAVDDFERSQIEQRISPVGQVKVQGQEQINTAQTPPQENTQASAPKESGQEIYEKYCGTCHGTGIAGAPKFRVEEDWKSRLAKGQETLLKNAINGINAMPPKGTCAECTEEEIKNAVLYMSSSHK
ncbi:c-type cytochrome [Legionella adelaidensis]|nr:c-type cytochrome [Legionella adelaidensis]